MREAVPNPQLSLHTHAYIHTYTVHMHSQTRTNTYMHTYALATVSFGSCCLPSLPSVYHLFRCFLLAGHLRYLVDLRLATPESHANGEWVVHGFSKECSMRHLKSVMAEKFDLPDDDTTVCRRHIPHNSFASQAGHCRHNLLSPTPPYFSSTL